jgi:hypothetical protein
MARIARWPATPVMTGGGDTALEADAFRSATGPVVAVISTQLP